MDGGGEKLMKILKFFKAAISTTFGLHVLKTKLHIIQILAYFILFYFLQKNSMSLQILVEKYKG